MTRRIVRWSAALLALLLVLLGLLAGGAWWSLRSDAGLRELAALAQRLSGGALRIGTTQGRLLGEFIINDFHYQGGDGTRVDVERLHLRLRPHELLSRRLHLEVAEVQGLQVWLPPPAPTSSPGETQLPSRLPLDLIVDALSLKDFQLHQPGETEPFRIASAALAGTWIGEDIDIARLSAELPQTGPLLLAAKARMADDRIAFSALSLKGPGEIDGSGTFAFGKSANDLKLSWKDLRWPLDGEPAERLLGGVDGAATLSGPLDHYRFELSTAAVLRKLPIKLAANGSGDLQQVQIADLGLMADKGSAHVQGKLAWAPLLRADLKGTIAQLDPALFAADWKGAINGTFNTQTSVQNGQPDIVFTATIDKSQLRGYPLSLSAQGDTDTRGVRLKQFLLQSGKGSLSATGTVGWEPALRADLKAQLANFDPAQFVAGFNGLINGSIVTQTTQRAGKPDIAFAVNIDHSQLRGNALTVAANADWNNGTVMVQKLALAAGATHVDASGQVTPPFDVQGKVDSPDLSQLAPQLGGHAAFDFSLQGALDDPHLVTKGNAQGLRYLAYRVARLDWDADLDPAKPSHLSLNASEAQAGVLIHSAKLNATGQETYHHVQLDVVSERGDVSVAVDGGFDRRKLEWGGQLSSGRLAPSDLPPWTLEHAAGLLLGASRQSLEPACFSGGGGRACLRLEQNVTAAGLRLSLDLDKLLLAAFKPVLPKNYDLSGEISGSGNIEIAHGDIAAINADLHTGGIHIQAPRAPPVDIQPSTLKADQQNGTLHALLDLHLSQGSISADVTAAPGADFQARPLSGHLQASIPDLGFVQSFVPELQSVSGSISGTLEFGGTVALPRVQGQIALKDGHAKVAQAGIELQQVQLSLTGQGEGPLAIDGSLQSGGGTLAINGTLDPSVSPPHADLSVKGENFQAVASVDARIWVTPDLHLLSDADGLHLEGTLTVPKAEITPQGLGNNGVPVSQDQIIVGAEQQAGGMLQRPRRQIARRETAGAELAAPFELALVEAAVHRHADVAALAHHVELHMVVDLLPGGAEFGAVNQHAGLGLAGIQAQMGGPGRVEIGIPVQFGHAVGEIAQALGVALGDQVRIIQRTLQAEVERGMPAELRGKLTQVGTVDLALHIERRRHLAAGIDMRGAGGQRQLLHHHRAVVPVGIGGHGQRVAAQLRVVDVDGESNVRLAGALRGLRHDAAVEEALEPGHELRGIEVGELCLEVGAQCRLPADRASSGQAALAGLQQKLLEPHAARIGIALRRQAQRIAAQLRLVDAGGEDDIGLAVLYCGLGVEAAVDGALPIGGEQGRIKLCDGALEIGAQQRRPGQLALYMGRALVGRQTQIGDLHLL